MKHLRVVSRARAFLDEGITPDEAGDRLLAEASDPALPMTPLTADSPLCGSV